MRWRPLAATQGTGRPRSRHRAIARARPVGPNGRIRNAVTAHEMRAGIRFVQSTRVPAGAPGEPSRAARSGAPPRSCCARGEAAVDSTYRGSDLGPSRARARMRANVDQRLIDHPDTQHAAPGAATARILAPTRDQTLRLGQQRSMNDHRGQSDRASIVQWSNGPTA